MLLGLPRGVSGYPGYNFLIKLLYLSFIFSLMATRGIYISPNPGVT